MSKKHIPNYPIGPVELEIEAKIYSLEESDVIKFARSPHDFLSTNTNPEQTQFLAAKRLGQIAMGLMENQTDSPDRSQRAFAEQLIGALLEGTREISDLSLLSRDSRDQFVDVIVGITKYTSLRESNAVAKYLSVIADQLNAHETVKIARYIGELFEQFPNGKKGDAAKAFNRVINRLYDFDSDLSFDDQKTLLVAVQAILDNGYKIELERAFQTIGRYFLITPDLVDENLDMLLKAVKSGPENHGFLKAVAGSAGRIAQSIQDYSDELTDDQVGDRLETLEALFNELADNPDARVRAELVEEIGFTLDRLQNFDHDVLKIIDKLANDIDPIVRSAFERQIQRGYLEPDNDFSFER